MLHNIDHYKYEVNISIKMGGHGYYGVNVTPSRPPSYAIFTSGLSPAPAPTSQTTFRRTATRLNTNHWFFPNFSFPGLLGILDELSTVSFWFLVCIYLFGRYRNLTTHSTVNSKWLLKTESPGISGVGSDHSANCTTSTICIFCFVG